MARYARVDVARRRTQARLHVDLQFFHKSHDPKLSNLSCPPLLDFLFRPQYMLTLAQSLALSLGTLL